MRKKLLKAPSSGSEVDERDFDLAYYLSLDSATRFLMIIERSILLLQLANKNRNAADPDPPALAKRVQAATGTLGTIR